ncbi:uncharacterized protein LOC124775326 [Schistocerca piceifrons]|uniref:uncharacterized protein LOC124775326 n=1 Tax=Schistocerca piceifrons TaxID=274613 RepID=UPI001F5F329D|nr:uncharacterized protein LOC124775326 [Schistocerca piceifrons]
MAQATDKVRGIKWSNGIHLEDLDFADDLCLLSHSLNDMKENLEDLKSAAEKVGLKIDDQKTKDKRTNDYNIAELKRGSQVIETVDKFCCLGSMIASHGGATEDINSGINEAKGAFTTLRSIWRTKEITFRTNLRIFESNVKSVLLRGCEMWEVTKQLVHKPQTFNNGCLRNIQGIRWPNVISHETLKEGTSQKPIELQIRSRKW